MKRKIVVVSDRLNLFDCLNFSVHLVQNCFYCFYFVGGLFV